MEGAGRSQGPLNVSYHDRILGRETPKTKLPEHYHKFLTAQREATSPDLKTRSASDASKLTPGSLFGSLINKVKNSAPVTALIAPFKKAAVEKKTVKEAQLQHVRTKAQELGVGTPRDLDKSDAKTELGRSVPGSSLVWESNGEVFGAIRGKKDTEVVNLSKANAKELKTFSEKMERGTNEAVQTRAYQLRDLQSKGVFKPAVNSETAARELLKSAEPGTFVIWKNPANDNLNISFSRTPLTSIHQRVVTVPVNSQGDINFYLNSIASSLQGEAAQIPDKALADTQSRNAQRFLRE